MKVGGVLGVGNHRRQIGAATEPALGRDHVACVEMYGRNVRVLHVRDHRDAGGPEARILLGAWHRLRKIRRELAVDGRDIDADLLEDAALHHTHHAATCLASVFVESLCRCTDESAGRSLRQLAGVFLLDFFEGGAKPVAQCLEAFAGATLAIGVDFGGGHDGNVPVWRSASPRTIAPACATLSERKPDFMGIRKRASARSWTKPGTPALSRPSRIVSSAENAKSV